MATLDEIGQERQRVSERLARLDTERAQLADQLGELEIAERVLTRFGRAERTKRRQRAGFGDDSASGRWGAERAKIPRAFEKNRRYGEPTGAGRSAAQQFATYYINPSTHDYLH